MQTTHSQQQKQIFTGIAFAIITCIIWSGNFVVARGISAVIPPVALAFYRLLLATICIYPLAHKKFTIEKQTIWQHKKHLFWVSLTGFSLYSTILYVAGHYTTAINLSLIGATSAPVFSVIIAVVLFHEHITINRIIGMIICAIGVLVLISQASWERLLKIHFSWGDLLILIGSAVFSFYNNLAKYKPATISSITYLFITFLIATITLFPFFIVETYWQYPTTIQWNWHSISTIVYLGVGCSIVAYLFWNKAIAYIGTSSTALFGNLIPVFSIIEAVLFLNEKFTNAHLIGGMVVFTGLIIANWSTKKST